MGKFNNFKHQREMMAGDIEAYRGIRDQLVDDRLGAYPNYRFYALFGFGLLLVSSYL